MPRTPDASDGSHPATANGHTRWSILGSGEGGTRIASLYFTRIEHPSVADRILLINTNRADLTNILEELRRRVDTDYGPERIEEIERGHVVSFGEERGAGNYFFQGEEFAAKNFDTLIRRKLQALRIGHGDAIVNVTTLGGGTGNGSIPYIIRALKSEGGMGLGKMYQFAIAAMPFENEDAHRHFNAVAGISRLLVDEEAGKQNADMMILCDNSRMESLGGPGRTKRDPHYYQINRRITDALDILTAAGRKAVNVIDVEDLVRLPGKLGLYHFTFGTSIGNDPEIATLELAMDLALEETFVKIDPRSVLIAYLIVRAPEQLVGQGDFTSKGVLDVFTKWRKKNLNTKVGMASLTINEMEESRFDILLLLGGFDLRPILKQPMQDFDQIAGLLALQEDNAAQSLRLQKIRSNLEGYLSRVDKARTLTRGVEER